MVIVSNSDRLSFAFSNSRRRRSVSSRWLCSAFFAFSNSLWSRSFCSFCSRSALREARSVADSFRPLFLSLVDGSSSSWILSSSSESSDSPVFRFFDLLLFFSAGGGSWGLAAVFLFFFDSSIGGRCFLVGLLLIVFGFLELLLCEEETARLRAGGSFSLESLSLAQRMMRKPRKKMIRW